MITVSISCITFNHASYIRQCLEGFLMQKCDFDFEILIHDDASTDGTEEIIKEYCIKYPELIKPIFEAENQYSKEVKGMMARFNFTRANGKYIALCEGDDYWTDPLKLQKQVEFLEHHPEYVMVFSNANVNIESSEGASNYERGIVPLNQSRAYSKLEIWDDWMIPTASVVFRNAALDKRYFDLAANKTFIHGDIILFLFLAGKGKLFGMADYMVTYRKHEGGVTNYQKSIKTVEIWYNDVREIIRQFGKDLLTNRKKALLADLSFDLSLNRFATKKIGAGLSYFVKSVGWSRKPFLRFLKIKMTR